MRAAFALMLCPLLAGSAWAEEAGVPLDAQLKAARAELAAAEAETRRLEQVAGKAQDEAGRLRADQAAAAQAIEAAEARITAADAQARLAGLYVAAHRRQLVDQQRPAALLLAGLAVMAQRPPLLALAADGGNTDELVKIRILLDSTLPAIRARTGRISAELDRGRRLQQALLNARAETVRGQQELVARRREFATLEQKASAEAVAAGGRAVAAGDVALTVGERAEQLEANRSSQRSSAALAAALAAEPPAPARPWAGDGAPQAPPFAYQLPANGPVTEGLGSVNQNGVRSRGLTLATARGEAVNAPGDGVVRFSGPFRDYDGVLIIDHDHGWISLLVNVTSSLRAGDKVRLGQPVGRALGPLLVELSQNGRRISPALIAGSSQALSKNGKGG
ncbi:MAG TPA: M23 family metallopeptidase [Sphingomicrobium sp.]|nr:M23 family metallopeptidase [Sphingomicrobium sp.]